jgi:excisionase family DNA binding protein
LEKLALRINEAAAASGLSRSKLYVEMREGRLRAVKAGGRRLIMRVDLEAYFAKLAEAA